MLPKLFSQIDSSCEIRIKKFCGVEDVSHLGAFSCGTVINIEVSVARRLGAAGVVCRIKRDGEGDVDIPLTRAQLDECYDVYACSLDTAEICRGEKSGLFYGHV